MSGNITAGYYTARAVSGEFGTAKTDTDQICVEFKIEEGPFTGQRVFWFGFFTDRTEERTVESLRHCGCTFVRGDVTDLTGLSENLVTLDIGYEPDQNGRDKLKVKWVNRYGSGPMANKMDDSAKKSFASRMRATVAATAQHSERSGAGVQGPIPGGQRPTGAAAPASTTTAQDAAAEFLKGSEAPATSDDIPY